MVPKHSLYSASKGAIESFVPCLAVDCGKKRITVNAIAPGGIVTDMFHATAKDYLPHSEKMSEEQIMKVRLCRLKSSFSLLLTMNCWEGRRISLAPQPRWPPRGRCALRRLPCKQRGRMDQRQDFATGWWGWKLPQWRGLSENLCMSLPEICVEVGSLSISPYQIAAYIQRHYYLHKVMIYE